MRIKGCVRQKVFVGLLNLFFLATCWSASGELSFAQSNKLLERHVTLHVKEGTLQEALGRLAGDESIPIGWEVSQNDFMRHDINVDFDKAPLKDVLDRLVLADPSYRWKLEDGVINIYPAFDRDEYLDKFLKIRIKEFSPRKGLYVFEFRDAILDLPEVRNFLESNRLEGSHTGNCCGGAIDLVDHEFRTANTDLRALLNKLIRETNRKAWVVSRSGESREFLHLGL